MSKSNALVFGFIFLVIGFVLGHAIAPSPSTPTAETEAPAEPPEVVRKATPIFTPPETRDTVLGILLDAVREPDAFARVTRLAAVLPALGPDVVPELRAVLDDASLDPGGPGIDLMVRWWAMTDPRGAALWATLKAGPGYKITAVVAAIETWAETDPRAAWAEVQTMALMPGDTTDAAEVAVVRGWFKSGEPGLTEFIQGLGMGPQRQRSIAVVARKTLQRDGAAAIIAWADAVPSDDAAFKLDVNRQVASAVTLSDPQAAAAWCETICDGPSGSMVRSLIAQRWADSDGRSAMEWAAAGPPGQESTFAVQGAFRGWFRSDREGLIEWVDAMGVEGLEPWFQPALEGLAIFKGKQDPREGARWAGAIAAPAARDRTYVTIARNWRKSDPEAADAWAEEMGFSGEIRGRITAEAFKRRGRTSAEMKAYLEGLAAGRTGDDGSTEESPSANGTAANGDSTDAANP